MITNHWPTPKQQAKQGFPKFVKIFELVKVYRLPDVLGARQYVRSDLIIHNRVNLLLDYHYNQIVHFLAYDWPLGYYADTMPMSVDKTIHLL